MSRAYVNDHRTPPGRPIAVDWYHNESPQCGGPVRSLYTRDAKRWAHVGWLCLRCGTVEVVDGMLREWDSRYGGAPRQPGGIAQLARTSTPAGSAEGRHPGDRDGVDEAAASPARVDTDVGVDVVAT